jgi:hypothetical protein
MPHVGLETLGVHARRSDHCLSELRLRQGPLLARRVRTADPRDASKRVLRRTPARVRELPHEKAKALRARRQVAFPLSGLQGLEEADDDFAGRVEWLQGESDSPSERHLVERLAVRYSLGPQEWRQGLLAFSFDSAFLDRLAGKKRGWANTRKQRLLADLALTPKARRLLAAHDAVERTISTQSVAWSYVAGLRGRSLPSAPPIRRAKENRRTQSNGHKPVGSCRAWSFTAYEPDGPATWYAYQTTLHRSTPQARRA